MVLEISTVSPQNRLSTIAYHPQGSTALQDTAPACQFIQKSSCGNYASYHSDSRTSEDIWPETGIPGKLFYPTR